jgi:internalin A
MPSPEAVSSIRIAKKRRLTRLHLEYTGLTEVPSEVFEIPHLERLYIRGNDIAFFPEGIRGLRELSLGMSHESTLVPEIPGGIDLSLEWKLYRALADSLSPDRIVGLTFSYPVSELPREIFGLKNLRRLSLWENNGPVEGLSRLHRLESLELHKPGFSEEILDLQGLTSLLLACSPTLPDLVGRLPNLRHLSLSGWFPHQKRKLADNPACPAWIWDGVALESLSLGDVTLGSVPAAAFQGWQLSNLTVTSTNLTSVPEQIANLRGLKRLNLSGNQLGQLPEFVFELNLETLWLAFCGMERLPKGIGNLSRLEALSLARNRLRDLPEEIHRLSELDELVLNGNPFDHIPDPIFELRRLIRLDLGWPDYVDRGIGDGGITDLPRELLQLENLVDLDVKNQPIEKPPAEIVAKGLSAIQDYYRQVGEVGVDYLCEAKLIVVGEPGAGKTTLTRKLQDSHYVLDSNEASTKGVHVAGWGFPTHLSVERDGQRTPLQRDFKVSIWDFGGQEIYQATHQFFLTRRSLYVLVADSRREDTDFNYWMNIVELLSDNSPLIIVQNEKQDRRRELDESRLRGRFSNLRSVHRANLADNRGLQEVEAAVRRGLEGLPHIGTPLPRTWNTLRRSLSADARDHITIDEFLDLCERAGFERLEDKLQLSGFLHDLGVCLHFQDDPLLNKTVILKPDWGTDAVYRVLDDPGVLDRYGRFTRLDLKRIWSEPKYSAMRDELLRLMTKFQLCYEIPETGSFIAPQLLRPAQPEYPWDPRNNLAIKYEYDFMPKGILTRFIVALHALIAEQDWVWRSGVVLTKDGAMAEVVEDYSHRLITVRASGADPRDLTAIVDWELERIHKTFPRLKYAKYIPCNCSVCRASPLPHFHRYDVVHKFALDGQSKIQCLKSYEMTDVQGLIRNIFKEDSSARSDRSEGSPARESRARLERTKEVFVSYAWTPESEQVVDALAAALQSRGVPLIRDKSELQYKDSIRDFMRRIGTGKCIVLVMSRRYLESHNCMFELTEIAEHGDFADRVFPIVLDDAGIFDVTVRLDYVKYWEDRKDRLNEKMKTVSQEHLEGIREEIDLYARIRRTVARLIEVLANMNTLTTAQLQRSAFEELYRKLDAKLSE